MQKQHVWCVRWRVITDPATTHTFKSISKDFQDALTDAIANGGLTYEGLIWGQVERTDEMVWSRPA